MLLSMISLDILIKLFLPELRIRARSCCIPTAWMPMPEAAMHKNGDLVFREDDVRRAWKIASVETKAESLCVKGTPDSQFRDCVSPLNTSHHTTSRSLVYDIH
jgi:hypothetical protein